MTIKEQFSIQIEKKPSEMTLQGTVPPDLIEKQKEQTIEDLRKNRSFDGYREGTIPTDILIQKVGDLSIWIESATAVVRSHIVEIIAMAESIPLGKPILTIQESALGGAVGFSIAIDIYPSITLPDYKEIARKAGALKNESVTEDEVSNALLQLRKDIFRTENMGVDVPSTPPPLTDDQAKALHPGCQTADQFVQFFRKSLEERKSFDARATRRASMMKEIINGMDVEISERLLEDEIDVLVDAVREDAKRVGTTFEDFLKEKNTDEKTMRSNLRGTAKERICVQLALNEISKKENIIPEEEKVTAEAQRIRSRDKTISEENSLILAKSIMANEGVFVLLESIADVAV